MFYYLHGRLSEQIVVTSMPNVRVHDVLSTSANLQGYGIFPCMSLGYTPSCINRTIYIVVKL
jgi:hypothetical protein